MGGGGNSFSISVFCLNHEHSYLMDDSVEVLSILSIIVNNLICLKCILT